MKRNLLFVICVAVLSATVSMQLSGQEYGSKKIKSAKSSLHLFDGKTLDGWYTYIQNRGRNNDPKEVFSVKDGVIRISGEEWGSLTSKEEFENYRLTVEYRWGEKTYEPRISNARDCGVLLHSQGEDGGSAGIWMHSIECQIIEGGTGDIIVVGDGSNDFSVTSAVAEEKHGNSFVFKPGGKLETINSGRINWLDRDATWKDTIGFRGARDVEKPLGKWNKLVCVADGDKLNFHLNEVLVNEASRVKPHKGRIQIQSEGAEIFFQKIELTPLP